MVRRLKSDIGYFLARYFDISITLRRGNPLVAASIDILAIRVAKIVSDSNIRILECI